MNGIDRITERIGADAGQQAKAVLAEAEAKCAEIRRENETKAHERYLELIRSGTKECGSLLSRSKSAAEMDSKKSILAMKQEFVAAAFDMAKQCLADMPEDSYLAFLTKLASEAAVTGNEELILSAGDRERLGSEVLSRANAAVAAKGLSPALALSDETREMRGGVILRRDGVEINCSIDALVEMQRESVTAAVAATLFE